MTSRRRCNWPDGGGLGRADDSVGANGEARPVASTRATAPRRSIVLQGALLRTSGMGRSSPMSGFRQPPRARSGPSRSPQKRVRCGAVAGTIQQVCSFMSRRNLRGSCAERRPPRSAFGADGVTLRRSCSVNGRERNTAIAAGRPKCAGQHPAARAESVSSWFQWRRGLHGFPH